MTSGVGDPLASDRRRGAVEDSRDLFVQVGADATAAGVARAVGAHRELHLLRHDVLVELGRIDLRLTVERVEAHDRSAQRDDLLGRHDPLSADERAAHGQTVEVASMHPVLGDATQPTGNELGRRNPGDHTPPVAVATDDGASRTIDHLLQRCLPGHLRSPGQRDVADQETVVGAG